MSRWAIVFDEVTVFVIVDTHVVVAALSGVLLWFVALFTIVCLLIFVHGEARLPLCKSDRNERNYITLNTHKKIETKTK